MNSTMLRRDFETLLVEVPRLENSDEAIAFDLSVLRNRPVGKPLIRRAFRFEIPSQERHRLFADGRELFVSVEPRSKEVLSCGVFSIPTEVLNSEQDILPLTFHLIQRVVCNPAWVVSSAINAIFGEESYGKN